MVSESSSFCIPASHPQLASPANPTPPHLHLPGDSGGRLWQREKALRMVVSYCLLSLIHIFYFNKRIDKIKCPNKGKRCYLYFLKLNSNKMIHKVNKQKIALWNDSRSECSPFQLTCHCNLDMST